MAAKNKQIIEEAQETINEKYAELVSVNDIFRQRIETLENEIQEDTHTLNENFQRIKDIFYKTDCELAKVNEEMSTLTSAQEDLKSRIKQIWFMIILLTILIIGLIISILFI